MSEPGAVERAAGVEAIAELFERLSGVEELALHLDEELTNYPAGGPWHWTGLDADQRRALWVELDAFVTWLQNRILNHLQERTMWIAPCWYQHEEAVELLTALMVAHKAAYHPKSKKASFQPVEWFTRALWPTIEVFKRESTFIGCLDAREHSQTHTMGVQLTAGGDAFAQFVDADAAAAAGVTADGEVLDEG